MLNTDNKFEADSFKIPGKNGLRYRFFPLIWALLAPIRIYLRLFPIQRGKGLFLRYILIPLLPTENMEFQLPVPGGANISLRFRETLGLSSLLYGTFEARELDFVNKHLMPGDCAMDIGANVGLFSLVMASKVGASGKVFSFEPLPANQVRLDSNIKNNRFSNVHIFPIALGATETEMMLRLARDPAYPSLHVVCEGLGDGTEVAVRVRTLDHVWQEQGCPGIDFVKIDVEGAEMDVLRGGKEFFSNCHPTILIEANSEEHLQQLKDHLMDLGYTHKRPEGFVPHNHLFIYSANILTKLDLQQ